MPTDGIPGGRGSQTGAGSAQIAHAALQYGRFGNREGSLLTMIPILD
jgi:hypothetical protein